MLVRDTRGRAGVSTSGAHAGLRRTALAAALYLALSGPAGASDTATTYFTINAPRLSSALIQLSQQSGRAIVFSDRLIRDLPAPELVGTSTTAEALDTLLAGTDLGWELVDDRVIAIYPLRCGPQRVACVSPEDVASQFPIYTPGLEETWVYGNQVTGSRIRRSGYTGGAPVDILSSPDIELSGAQTLGELLKFVPAVSGNALSTAVSNGGDGTATVTLRGLPASNTLVLINGRRVANDGLAGESVDLNSIPPAAVERIEILKDGASAIYGSDAIAGVVNVIMKRDFHGVLAEAFYGETREGDLDTQTWTVQYGTGLPEGSFFVTASHYEQDAILARDRRVSRSADTRFLGGTDQRSSATPDARIVLPDGATVIADGAGYRAVDGDDLFDYQAFTTAVVPMTRSSLYANASYDFSEQITAYLDFSYLVTDAEAVLAPTPIFTAFEAEPLPVAADQVYNAFGETLEDVRRRLLELPSRTQRNQSEVTRFSAVTEGLFSDWHWDIGFTWSRSEAEETTANIVNADRLRRALGPAAGCRGSTVDGCVPVNLTGPRGSISPEQVDYIRTRGEVSGYSQLSAGSVNLTRGIDILPAGRLDLAMGLEVRHESTSKRPSQLLAGNGTIGATNFQATRGDRNVTEVYVEGLVPVWKSASGLSHFDLEAAVRFSDYNDFNDSTNPKLALRWQVGPDLLLRANYAEGFRAPSLNELYAGVTESQDFLEDPCTRPENVGVLPGCTQLADPTRNQFLTLKGGNTGLRPETSDSYSTGLVWTPAAVAGLAMSLDYFLIKQYNVVSSSAQFVLSRNARDGSFANRIERDEAGNLTLVEATNINVGERRVDGVDMALTYHYPDRRWGQFSLVGSATYIDGYETRVDPDAPLLDLAGTFRDEASEGLGGIPRWKAQLGMRWNRERWRGSWQVHFVDGMREQVPGTDRTRDIDSWVVHDLQLSYNFDLLKGLRLTLGIDNLFDESAPLAASAFNDNIDGRTHELKGRYWYSRLSQRL